MKIKPTNDLLFKKIFASKGNEHILKAFIEDVLDTQFKKVYSLNPYNINDFKDGKANHTEVDILAITDQGETINIELQNINHDYFADRTLYYTFFQFVEGLTDESRRTIPDNLYSSLNNTYGIFIHDFYLFNSDKNRLIRSYVLKDEETNSLMVDDLNVSNIKLTYFNLKGQTNDPVLLDWIRLFKGEKPSNQAPEYIIQAWQEASYNKLTEEEKTMAQAINKREAIRAAELSTATREGIEIGQERGIEIGQERGIEIGKEQGREEERNKTIKNLLEAGFPLKDIYKYLNLDSDMIREDSAKYKIEE